MKIISQKLASVQIDRVLDNVAARIRARKLEAISAEEEAKKREMASWKAFAEECEAEQAAQRRAEKQAVLMADARYAPKPVNGFPSKRAAKRARKEQAQSLLHPLGN